MFPLFPERALDSSIHVAILVALVIMWLLTETLGWPFVGFVVGGYLATILLTHLPSFVVICLEAILTYGLVWAAGTGAMRLRLSHRAFGRERFLLFVLFSVPVRLFVEGIAAPHLPGLFGGLLGESEIAMGEFHGIGLVLVPLLANTFWKVGLAFGMLQTGTVVASTYLVITGALVPLTNLHLGRFELTFESAALDFLNSPKLYFILVTTAVFAAHNSVRYGWDVGGILVPALMALTLLRPEKLAATLIEVVALVTAYSLVIRLPYLRSLNLEGPRRLVSVYTMSFGLKFVVTWAVQLLRVGVYVSDYFGFGYLLTSLVATKCISRREVVRVVVPALVTAAQGFAAGTLLTVFFAWAWGHVGTEALPAVAATRPIAHSVPRAVLLSQAAVLTSEPPSALGETLRYRRALDALGTLLDGSGPEQPVAPRAEGMLAGLMHVEMVRHSDGRRCAWMHTRSGGLGPGAGLPSVLWCGGDGALVAVPHPLDDPEALWMAAYLAEQTAVAAVVVAGEDQWMSKLANAWAMRRLRVRQRILRNALGDRTVYHLVGCRGGSYIAPRSLVPDLRQQSFADALADLQVVFRDEYGEHQSTWESLDPRDALLCVDPAGIERHMAMPAARPNRRLPSLASWLKGRRKRVQASTYDFGSAEERLAFARVVVRAARRWAQQASPDAVPPERLRYVTRLFDYEVEPVEHMGETVWALWNGSERVRGWGAVVLRPAAQAQLAVLVPDGTTDDGTSELAADLFGRSSGEAFWLQDEALHRGLTDRDVQVRLRGGHVPAIEMVLRELLRPTGDTIASERLRAVTVLARPLDGNPAEVIVSGGRELELEVARRLATELPLPASWRLEFARGGADDPATSLFQIDYLRDLHPGASVALWVREDALASIDGSPTKNSRLAMFRRLGIPVRRFPPRPQPADAVANDAAWSDHLETYRRSGLIGPLRSLLRAGARVAAYDHTDGLEIVARDARVECRARLASRTLPTPGNACWRRR